MRLAGKAVGGYFPTPPSLVARIAALVSVAWEGTPAWSTLNVIDPCAGDGAAAFGAMRVWSSDAQRAAGRVRFYGVEMERGRALALIERTRSFPDRRAVAFHGDGLRVDVSASDTRTNNEGAGAILYLNPPYDADRECGRLEERFLRAWTPRLAPGGVLVLLVPVESLAASADTLARFYTGLRCFRFPEAEYAAFRQVVLVARREHGVERPDPTLRLQVLLWASDPASIPVLPEVPASVIEARLPMMAFVAWAPRPVDAEAIRAAFRPWAATSRTGDLGDVAGILPSPSASLLRAEWPVAMPPRPSHIAAALAAGVFSGAEVEPDDPSTGLPRLLLKAVFERIWVPREEKTNTKGEVVGEMQQQVTRLAITALDLSTYAYHALSMSGDVTGATTMGSAFTAGDLLARYKRSLASVLRDRCQVLHDPQRDGEDVALPTLARPLYAAQAQAARAAVKLLERGDGTQPLLLGEIGSGKCLGLGTKVMRFDGTLVNAEDVRVGDVLMGPDSTPRRVLGTTRGRGPLYRVVPVTGEPWVCNDAHLLTLVHTMGGDVVDVEAKTFATSRRLRASITGSHRTTHARNEFKQFFPERGVDFESGPPLPIDPYFLGVWYGDGTKGMKSVSVTKPDPEIRDLMYATAEEWGLAVRVCINSTMCPTWSLSNPRRTGNQLMQTLRAIVGDGRDLPHAYLTASRADRLAFLAGLIDTDGHLSNGVVDIVQKRREWADGICFLARSLGIRATMCEKIVNGESYWRVCLSGELSEVPMRIPRKQASPRAEVVSMSWGSGTKSMKRVSRTGIHLESIGDGEYAGFQLDGDGRFLLGDFTVTHNSSVALAVAAARRRRSVLVMCPPHLLTSWRKQTTVVFGDVVPHEVFHVDSVTDVDTYAAWRASKASAGRVGVVLLSRERAKLGHAWESVTTERCPACGAFLGPEKSPGERARRRLVCEAVDRTPRNAAARIVEGLSVALLHRWPDHPSVDGNVQRGLREAMRKVVKARLAAGRPAINTSRSEATLRAPVRLAAERALDMLHAETDYRAESTQREFLLRLVSALGDEALALDVAERALAYPTPKDRYDHTAQNAITRAVMAALSLCLLVRTPRHRERRDAVAKALCARIPAPSFREWQTKAESLAGESVSLTRGDHWHSLSRASGGGLVLTLDGAKHAFGDLDDLPEALRAFEGLASWRTGRPCGSPLYQPEGEAGGITQALQRLRAVAAGEAPQAPTPTPGVLRRVPLATYIARSHAGLFDFMVADEAHELSSETSAQGRASTRLVSQIPEVLHLTGSSSNGYASSLFTMLWNASPRFRREFRRDEEGRFVELYGLRKRLMQEVDTKGKVVAFGSHSDRVQVRYTDKGDAPGVLPLLILKHVLPIAVTIQKADLKLELPAHEERVITVKPDADLASAHLALLHKVIERVKKDAFSPLAGKLWGALAHLPSHADRATEDTGNWTGEEPAPSPMLVAACGIKDGVIPRGAYVVAYPASAYGCAGNPVAIAAPLPPSVPTAKERALVKVVREELAEGRRVMVHAWHEPKCARLAKILADALGEPVARLDAKKVSPAKREEWIDSEVVAKGRRVMVVNPVAVQTGLNNLVWFHSAVWVENPNCNPVIYDQASGRIDRIGKTSVSRSIFLVYALPTQEGLHHLLMHKAGVLRAIDGLDGDAALAMAGATDDNVFAGMGLGRELYAMLTGEAA